MLASSINDITIGVLLCTSSPEATGQTTQVHSILHVRDLMLKDTIKQ